MTEFQFAKIPPNDKIKWKSSNHTNQFIPTSPSCGDKARCIFRNNGRLESIRKSERCITFNSSWNLGRTDHNIHCLYVAFAPTIVLRVRRCVTEQKLLYSPQAFLLLGLFNSLTFFQSVACVQTLFCWRTIGCCSMNI